MRLKEIGMGTLPDEFVAAQMSDKYAWQYRQMGIHWTAALVQHYREGGFGKKITGNSNPKELNI